MSIGKHTTFLTFTATYFTRTSKLGFEVVWV